MSEPSKEAVQLVDWWAVNNADDKDLAQGLDAFARQAVERAVALSKAKDAVVEFLRCEDGACPFCGPREEGEANHETECPWPELECLEAEQ